MPTRCSHWPGNRSGTRNDHGGATSSPCGVVRDFAVTDFTFNAQIHIHRRQKNTITQFKSSDSAWSEKCFEMRFGHH